MKYGCIGEKLGHSFSKEIHNKIADYEYELKEIKKEDLEQFITSKNYMALNVTIPYKEKVIPYLDEIEGNALSIGAVNTIVNRDGRLYGYNTDFDGMVSLIYANGITLKGKKVLILGTGGTSRTAQAVAKYLEAREIIKASRSGKDGALTYEEVYKNHTDTEVIINTTPCGMFPNTESSPIDVSLFKNLSGAADAVYNPLRTEFVQNAKSFGAKASGGLYMLVAQAVRACEHFLGKKISDSVIDNVYSELMLKKENIVLVGMPGAGKTTIGKLVSEKTGKRFLDSDEEITRIKGKTPAEIIEASGESVFRDIEEEIIENLSKETGCVIATGGGAVLRDINVKRLKRNGTVVFLDRNIEKIVPTDNRPLSQTQELLKKRYSERYPIYSSACDIHMKIEEDADKNAKTLIERIKNK